MWAWARAAAVSCPAAPRAAGVVSSSPPHAPLVSSVVGGGQRMGNTTPSIYERCGVARQGERGGWRARHMVKARGRVARGGATGGAGAGVLATRTRLPMACLLSSLFRGMDGFFRSCGQPTRAGGDVRFAMADAGADCRCSRAGSSRVRGEGCRQEWCGGSEFQRRYGIGAGTDVTKWLLNWNCVTNILGSKKVEHGKRNR